MPDLVSQAEKQTTRDPPGRGSLCQRPSVQEEKERAVGHSVNVTVNVRRGGEGQEKDRSTTKVTMVIVSATTHFVREI